MGPAVQKNCAAKKSEGWQGLETSFRERIKLNGAMVHTCVCSTDDGDKFADFIISNEGRSCRTYQQEYRIQLLLNAHHRIHSPDTNL